MISINGRTVIIKLTRREVVDLLLACDAMSAESDKWNAIGDKIRKQLNVFDLKMEGRNG